MASQKQLHILKTLSSTLASVSRVEPQPSVSAVLRALKQHQLHGDLFFRRQHGMMVDRGAVLSLFLPQLALDHQYSQLVFQLLLRRRY